MFCHLQRTEMDHWKRNPLKKENLADIMLGGHLERHNHDRLWCTAEKVPVAARPGWIMSKNFLSAI